MKKILLIFFVVLCILGFQITRPHSLTSTYKEWEEVTKRIEIVVVEKKGENGKPGADITYYEATEETEIKKIFVLLSSMNYYYNEELLEKIMETPLWYAGDGACSIHIVFESIDELCLRVIDFYGGNRIDIDGVSYGLDCIGGKNTEKLMANILEILKSLKEVAN